jgi:hypothetical protein
MSKEIEIIPDSIKEFINWLPKSDFHTREKAFTHFSSRGVESYIIMGAILCKSRDAQDWDKAKCQNMKEYCENELRISYTQAIRMMTIVDKLLPHILKHHEVIKNISFVNLYEVARVATLIDEAQLGDLLTQASHDTERGFKNNIREIEKKITPTDQCDHISADKFFYKCRNCQTIRPIELPELKKRFIDGT